MGYKWYNKISYEGLRKVAIMKEYLRPAYEKLIFYRNICQTRREVFEITKPVQHSSPKIVGQVRDAARSAKQNIIEGYKRDSIGSFILAIKTSRASLGEVGGDLEDLAEDGLIDADKAEELRKLVAQTQYLMDHYVDSLIKMKENNTWKHRFKK